MAKKFRRLMIRLISVILFCYIFSLHSYGQADSLIYTLPPPDLKWGIPSEILFSPDDKYFLVSYDFKPSYVDLYQLDGFKRLRRFKIKGHFVYFSNSFFHSDNREVYIDIGKRININIDIGKRTIGKEKIKYLVFNVQSGERKIVKCEDGPKGCEYPVTSPHSNPILREYSTFDKSLLFKIEKKKINIYKN